MNLSRLQSLLTPSESERAVLARLDYRTLSVWAATWLGCGFMRPAPGTWGSLGAIPPALLLVLLGGPKYLLVALILVIALGFWASARFEAMSGEKDSKMIVIDEVAGQWIALWPVLSAPLINPWLVLAAFILFRLFDITKPFPVGWFDRKLTGPVSVMGDDIAAGLIAALILEGLIRYAGFA
ncbi:MAG: phosphatidylglycerophosphatase A [Alphaproteobacteria bacterium]|nr:phosphatidylglycerophosphatase A [Alphaproteobacteria bacterium]